MSFLRLKTQVSTFFEQQLDSTRQRLDSNLSSCLIENPTASRLTEALDSLDSLDSNLEGRGGSKKPCNIGNIVQKAINNELNYPQHQTNTDTDQETLKGTDPDLYDLIYGKPTEELLYNHLLTCNQCEHLSFTGSCSRLGKRVNPQALRECGSFQLLKKERPQIEEVKPYTQDELNRLLNQAAKPLYFHLIDCEQCSLEDMRYCVDCFTTGNTFDCLLLCFDDAANKRYELMNQVIKARISGKR